MNGLKILAWTILAPFVLVGTGSAAKLYGDTIWLPISEYKQEKLYDLEDAYDEYGDREDLGEFLTPLDILNRKRLLKRIDRLKLEI